MDLPDNDFAVFRTLFISGYSEWIYKRIDLLYCGYRPYHGVESIVVHAL